MAEEPEAGIEVDLAKSIISILETTNSPEIQRAREVIAHRLAVSGDVAPSRIPPPRNITEIGGYINLLTEYEQIEQRSRMISAALGIAGPQINLPQPGEAPPLFFARRNQLRPEGSQQPTFPLDFTIRSDFAAAFDTALAEIANRGGAMPVLSPLRTLPAQGAEVPGAGSAQLDLIGRLLRIAPTAALRDLATDPLSLSRPTAGGEFAVLARVIDAAAPDAGTIADEDWTSWVCDTDQCTETNTTDARFALAPLLNTVGWHRLDSPTDPASVSDPGDWPVWRNVTGLVPGETRFGDEVRLIYSAAEIVNSSILSELELVWDGAVFSPA